MTIEPETAERLRKFLDAAASEGWVFADIDAGELFLELFPGYYNDAASGILPLPLG